MSLQSTRLFRSPSLLAAWITGIIIFYSLFNIANWRHLDVVRSDVCGYYSFLPAVFIYQDLHFGFDEEVAREYSYVVWTTETPDGRTIQKYPIGMSVLYTPFFLPAHWFAESSRYPADGYSLPYQMAITLSGGFYLFMGLFFLRLLLLRFFSEKVAALTILSVMFATNLYYYSTTENAMSHVYSFCLFAAFLLYTLRWLEKPSIKNSLLTVVFSGLILLIRPTNGLILLVPLLYGINGRTALKERIQLISKRSLQLLLMAMGILLILLPQLLYWKYATGEWVYYSYVGERFYFDRPQILNGLFSFRKGWLLYTPVMALVIPGIILLKRKGSGLWLPVTIFLVLNVYVVFSWWCWWYGGSFGARPVVESYALLALPLAAVFDAMVKRKNLIKYTGMILLLLLAALNLFQTQQKRLGIIHPDGMNKALYKAVFLKLKRPDNFWNLVESPDYESAGKGESEKSNYRIKTTTSYAILDFDNDSTAFADSTHAHSVPYSLPLGPNRLYSPNIAIPFEDFPDPAQNDLRLSGSVHYYHGGGSHNSELIIIIQFQTPGEPPFNYNFKSFKIPDGGTEEWKRIEYDVKVPRGLRKGNFANIFIHVPGPDEVLIDDMEATILKVELY